MSLLNPDEMWVSGSCYRLEVRRESGGLFLGQVDSEQGEPWYLTRSGEARRRSSVFCESVGVHHARFSFS